MADFDNNGFKDMFVSNGYRKNTRDNDFLIKWDEKKKELGGTFTGMDAVELERKEGLGSTRLMNYYFENNGDLTFSYKSVEVGMDQLGFSSGAAYADLDLDGDLDLIVTNLIDPVSGQSPTGV